MFFGLFKPRWKQLRADLDSLRAGVKHAFKHIKNEFDDHLEAINRNTGEIQSVYEVLSDLDNRIEKLSERVDDMHMFVNPSQEQPQDIDLTLREQEVFVTLYAEGEPLRAIEVGRRLGFTQEMVNKYVYTMVSKGVPVLRSVKDETLFVSLEENFRTLQAKHNIVSVDEGIRRQLIMDKYR